MGAAPILAPILGSQVLLVTSWRGIFVVFAAFGVACTVAVAAWLPESLPPARRSQGGIGTAFASYGHLLRDGRFTAFALASGFASGLLFSYITGSSAVLMGIHGVSAQQFALFFGGNALGMVACSQLNRRLLKIYSPAQILRAVYHLMAAASVLLLVHGWTGWGGLPVLATLLLVLLSSLGFVMPNLSALTMAPYATQAGSASALMGTAQYAVGSSAGALVSLFHNGTARPMATLMGGCGLVGWVLAHRALRRT